jgi:hypothetical protein
MKPLNLDNRPCSPISSNCVIWQGPDIPCIKICNGDTVSDIVYQLGTELCTIMEQLNVSNYDLSCFNLTACPPEDFQALIQLLIDKICEANGITVDTPKSSGCPDCVVGVADCFVQGTTITMQLVDYVQMIANRVCSIISEIESINNQISVINTTLNDLQTQIDNLPLYTLPTFEVDCILGPGEQALDVIVEALMNDDTLGYCRLLASTGTPAEINTAVLTQCIEDSDQPLAALALSPPVTSTFSAYYSGSWVNAATLGTSPTVSNALNNIWIAICDIRAYVTNFPTTVVAAGTNTTVTSATLGNVTTYTVSSNDLTVQDTTTVNLTNTAGTLTAVVQDTGWVNLNGFDWYGPNVQYQRPQCRRIGNQIHFRGTLVIPLQDTDGTPLEWDYKSSGPAINSYANVNTVAPSTTGLGSVDVALGGSITFNESNNVIPASVLPLGQNLDKIYYGNFTVALRIIKIYTAGSDVYTGALSTLLKPIITADKKLILQLVKDLEIAAPSTLGTQTYGTSILNNVISHVRVGEFVPKFQSSSSVMASSSNGGPLDTITLPVGPNTQYIGNTKLDYDSTLTYPFSCNASNQDQIGGFGWLSIDNLSAFISPCDPIIPTPEPCIPS